MAETDFQRKGSKVEVESFALSSNFTVLSSAMDLYNKGLNVFPVLKPNEIRKLAIFYPHAYSVGEKRPYILQPLFTSRMHLCDEFCVEREQRTHRVCPGSKPGINFQDLFQASNLGVMMGRTSSNLVCIDCDSENSFQVVYQEFVNRDLDFWAFQTSRGGNLMFQVEYELRNQPKHSGSAIEIWGSNHFCVLPPSVHESGAIYTWLRDQNPFSGRWIDGGVPRLSNKALDWLGIDGGQYMKSRPIGNLPTWARMLSIPNQKILSGTLTQGTRNSQLIKPAYEIAALIENGLVAEDDGLNVLIDAAERANPPYPEKQVRQMLKSARKKKGLTTTREFYGHQSKVAIWDQALRFAGAYDWNSHGRTALTDMALFRACCERSRMDRGQPFRASVREISELANIASLKTARRAMKRLIQKGLIEFDQKTAGGTYCYRFGIAVDFASDHSNTTCNSSVVPTKQKKPNELIRLDLIDDIFGKIGRVSRICWEYLIEHPEKNISTLSKSVKANYHSVYYTIPRLLQLGFVSWSSAEGLYIGEDLSNSELIEIARKIGVYGKTKNRRRYHAIEREIRVNKVIYQKKREILKMLV